MAVGGQLDYTYETSDDSSESELLDRSLSVWKGLCCEENEVFTPIPLDLHTASSIGQYDCVRSIIQREEEVDLNKKNRGGWTALMYASYIGHDTVVDLLLDAGVSVNVRNKKDQTPLILAASCGNENVAYLLLQAGAELEAQDTKGWTALFHATYSGHQNMVKFLLDSGAHTETVEPSCDFTPFMEAAAAGHEIIVQCFLQHGVNVNAKTTAGETPRTLAHINGHIKIVSLIDNHLLGPAHPIRSISGSSFDGDLSSSDEAYNPCSGSCSPKKKSNSRNSKIKTKGPNIGDGPERLAKIIDKTKTASDQRSPPKHFTESCVPCGYVTFVHSEPEEVSEIRFRDMTSPISLEDHPIDSSDQHVDSSDGRDSYELDDETDVFSKTGALTIKSSSSSSGGLVAALGLSRADSQVDKSLSATPGTIHIPGTAVQPNTSSNHASSQPTNYLDDASNEPSVIKNTRGDHLNNTSSELKWHGQNNEQGEIIFRVQNRSKFKSMSPSRLVQHDDDIHEISSRPSDHSHDVSNEIIPVDSFNADASSNPDQPSLFEHLQDYGSQHSEFNTYQYFNYDQTASDNSKTGVEPGAEGGVPSDTMITKAMPGDDDPGRPKDLAALLDQIGLPKYLPTFAEQDVDLQVFLSLTDNDLKEIGIKLFGPRRKMTNAIARWHSEARPSRNDLEQTYADKLEAEMQELAIQLHQAYEQINQLKQQVLQETKLRSVTESWLMEDRVAWQHVHHVATDTRQRCGNVYTLLETVRHFQEELARRLSVKPEHVSSSNRGSLAVALQQRLSVEDNVIPPIEIAKLPTPLIFRKMHELFRDLTGTVAVVAINSDKLLGREIDYNCTRDEIS